MHVTVRTWGHSASDRIASSIMEAANVRLDRQVDVRAVWGVRARVLTSLQYGARSAIAAADIV